MAMNPIVSSSSLICLVGGASLGKTEISAIFPLSNIIVAVDGGADHLLQAGVMPAAVIGDLDSLSAQARDTFAHVLCHISEQSTTDFEKALLRVAAPVILGLGFTGGRMDHILSVLNVMARHADRAIVLIDDDDVCFLAPLGASQMDLPQGARIAIMPLDAANVSVTGLQWNFTEMLMTPAGFTSPSNAAVGGIVTLQTDGPVLVTLPRAHLQTALKAAVRV